MPPIDRIREGFRDRGVGVGERAAEPEWRGQRIALLHCPRASGGRFRAHNLIPRRGYPWSWPEACATGVGNRASAAAAVDGESGFGECPPGRWWHPRERESSVRVHIPRAVL